MMVTEDVPEPDVVIYTPTFVNEIAVIPIHRDDPYTDPRASLVHRSFLSSMVLGGTSRSSL